MIKMYYLFLIKFPFKTVILVDPYRVNSVVLKDQAAVQVGPYTELKNNHEYSLYQAEFLLYNQENE